MGHDYWPYGVDGNRKTLEAFIRYCRDQGITHTDMKADELFAEQTLETFRV